MDFARTPNPLARLADVRYQNAIATEAHLKPTLEPSHRLLTKDARKIYTSPPPGLLASGHGMAAAGPISTRSRTQTPPALGRASAVSRPLNAPGMQTGPSTGASFVQAGKRFTRGNLVRPRRDQTSSANPVETGPTVQESLRALSPTKQREELLRQSFGDTGGWWANEFIDLFDSVTPALEFIHRRRQGVPFDLEDVFIASSIVPGLGKGFGKVGRKASKFFVDEVPPSRSARTKPSKTAPGNLRNVVGKATYDGKLPVAVEGKPWLRGSHRNAGKIPHQIAVKLAGRQYKDWRHFRRSFWREVVKSEILARQFDAENIQRMKRGVAPLVEELQLLGKRESYNIDHVKELRHGGGLYNLNNLYIRSPLNHVKGK